MSENVTVSVIVPVYNAEKYLGTTLQSILDQTYDNLEIIIIDDGSQDSSASIVGDIQSTNPDIIHYFYQQNQGVAVARNTGITKANGEYIAFLDSDDFWHPTKVEKQMNSMSRNKMNACYCGFINFMDQTSSESKQITKYKKGDITKEFLTHRVFAQTSTWIIKKSVLIDNDIIFTPGANWGEDLEFIFKVISIENVCYVEEHLTFYRVLLRDNLSSKYKNYNLKTEKELAVFNRVSDWIINNKDKLISSDNTTLLKIIETYIKPHIIIDNACIYFKMNKEIEKNTCNQIKKDLADYTQKIYYQNGMKSIKLLLKLVYVKLRLLGLK